MQNHLFPQNQGPESGPKGLPMLARPQLAVREEEASPEATVVTCRLHGLGGLPGIRLRLTLSGWSRLGMGENCCLGLLVTSGERETRGETPLLRKSNP